jgi:integrase
MASIYKHSSNKWVAAIRRKGFPTSTRTFTRYTDAKQWANEAEVALQRIRTEGQKYSLHEAIDRFESEVVPLYKSQKTARWMLNLLKRRISNLDLGDISPAVIAEYRDNRLSEHVAGSSVNKELNILSRLFDYCIREWEWLQCNNPVKQIKRPSNNKHRDRRPSEIELQLIKEDSSRTGNAATWNMIVLAIETGMRQSELLNLEIINVHQSQRYVHLPDTKNGHKRDVPLSTTACKILKNQIGERVNGKVFNSWSTADGFRSAWKRCCKRVSITDLRFHDLRHEAASRLFERGLNQFQVAAITGHRSLQSLQRYTHLKATDLARLLD